MNINILKAKELRELIDSDDFRKMEHLPISTIRAISHLNNPRLKEDDVILLTAYEHDKFAGYLGALPDDIFVDGKTHHIAWLSCLWVDNSMRGKGVAAILLSKMCELWNHDLFIVNFTPAAKRAYDKTKAFDFNKSVTGIRGYMRLNLHQLQPRKNPKHNKIKWLYHLIDFNFNIIYSIRLGMINYKRPVSGLNITEIHEIENDLAEFISKNNAKELMKRGKTELNWIINFPWLKDIHEDDGEHNRYEFSSVAKDFKLINLKISGRDDEIIGFLMLHIRDKEMQIPYSYFNDIESEKIVWVIYFYMHKLRIRTLTAYHTKLVAAIKTYSNPFFKTRELTRTYLITHKLKKMYGNISSYNFQDGDGDSAFT